MGRMVAILALAVTALAAHAGTTRAADGPRLALVLVNSAYTRSPALESCRFSGGLMTAALRRAGFEVKELSNLSNGRTGAALAEFGDTLADAGNATAVLYTCGYAISFERRAFLLPVAATLERPTDVLSQGLLERQIVGSFGRTKVKAGLILFDTRGQPGDDSVIDFATVAEPGHLGNWAFIGAHGTGARPSGSSALVDTMHDRLDDPTLELSALVRQWQQDAATSTGVASLAVPPDHPAYLIGAAPAAAPPPAAPTVSAPAILTEADRRRVQLALARLGYYTGPADGVHGPGTIASIRRYQSESGAPATGVLTEFQLAALLRTGH
jgi:hypothetical protein